SHFIVSHIPATSRDLCVLAFYSPSLDSPSFFFFFNAPAPTEIYTLSLHDALPISGRAAARPARPARTAGCPTPRAARPAGRRGGDRKSTRLNSSHVKISYAVFCLKKKKKKNKEKTRKKSKKDNES